MLVLGHLWPFSKCMSGRFDGCSLLEGMSGEPYGGTCYLVMVVPPLASPAVGICFVCAEQAGTAKSKLLRLLLARNISSFRETESN